ncbi:MAG: RNA polymerase factor sigma-54 [Rudaea sp.]|uniref:RNA polymerase factor sigma-54 n=1 Tax=Rudaea sp. TaxID=2136325 RepID=UPI0039E47DCC
MKPALQLRLHQQLSLTPQLQQAIKLLQMSSIELEVELRQVIESNPLLELEEASDGDDEFASETEFPETEGADDDGERAEASGADDDTREVDDFELAGDFEDDGSDYGNPKPVDDDGLEKQEAQPEDLRDHLLWQLNLTALSLRDRAIGTAIIEAVDEDGYLHEDAESLCASLTGALTPGGNAVAAAEVEAMRHRIQCFDPIGVASRNLAECLRAQLDAFDPATPGLNAAREIVAGHLDVLARNDRERLARQLHVDAATIDLAIALIRSLDPKPGARYNSAPPEFVAPDAYARRVNGRWAVSLSPHCQPQLSINRHYSGLIARAQRDDAQYLRGQLQEARWLIKSLATRAETMLKVASAIVRAQSAFLDFGPEAMRPLVLRDIADEIGMHESTVSRMTTRKYLHTPRGTFEFKFFFSSGVGTVDGGAASATAIQAMIKKLIDEEIPRKPLSDQALAAELNRRGIEVARRTVAKYREGMNIPSSSERGRLCLAASAL